MSERTHDPNEPADGDFVMTVSGLWVYKAAAGRWVLDDASPVALSASWTTHFIRVVHDDLSRPHAQ